MSLVHTQEGVEERAHARVDAASSDCLQAGRRVLTFCDYYGAGTSGGAERVTAEVLRVLRNDGVTTEVVSAAPPARLVANDGERIHHAKSVDLSKALRVQLQYAPNAMRVAEKAFASFQPDVLYAHSLHFQSAIAAARLKRRHGVPLVTTVHVGAIEALPAPARAATKVWESSIGRFILRGSDVVIAVSDAVADHVAKLGVAPRRVRVIENGVDHHRFRPGSRVSTDTLEVIFVGRLIGNKAPELVIGALAELRARTIPARVTFVGDGPERAALDSLSRELGVEHMMRFLGERNDVEVLLRDADVFVRPSLTEGMSLAVLEAMATGLCVVASDIPANRELLGDNQNGLLVRPGDSGELARALIELAATPDKRRALGNHAQRAAAQRSWTRCATETSAVLEGAIRGNHS